VHEQHPEDGGQGQPDRRVALPGRPQRETGAREPGQIGDEATTPSSAATVSGVVCEASRLMELLEADLS